MLQIITLEYSESMLEQLRRACAVASGFIWLDSASPWNASADQPNELLLFNPDWQNTADEDVLSAMLERCDTWGDEQQQRYTSTLDAHSPSLRFRGGLAGVLPYPALEPSDQRVYPAVGDYRNFVEIQHDTQRIFAVVADEESYELIQQVVDDKRPIGSQPDFSLTSEWQWAWDRGAYQAAFNQVQAYLAAGDCYQVNLTQQCRASFAGPPFEAYWQLRGKARAPFSAYVSLGRDTQTDALLCFSPERFLRIEKGQMLTSPIKGTRARLADEVLDSQQRQSLSGSDKDRAENLMIVDLLRNDLSRFARKGSVKVPELFALHSFSNVHHLISHVTAELDPAFHPLEALIGCFPGGSITGAPKQRAREIIEELEAVPRGYYCGTVFSYSRSGLLDSNIAIRSVHCAGGSASVSGGGGITTGSVCEAEYDESVDKIRHLMEGLSRL
ncbi:MAG: aminodeoxychorismate synthase, component I [unclassified Hahellaceae]|nr:aminodeoxychorismate synthase, component I [Hahellaceae bacterium]